MINLKLSCYAITRLLDVADVGHNKLPQCVLLC